MTRAGVAAVAAQETRASVRTPGINTMALSCSCARRPAGTTVARDARELAAEGDGGRTAVVP
jgi:hypothetical protein